MACAASFGADWPMYRHDTARSGVTPERVKTPLVQSWLYRPAHAPRPAWGKPNPRQVGGWYGLVEKPRMHFDDAFHVVAAGGAVYFASSADGKVYALDAATGQARWSFLTDGPVRLAPTVVGDRLYVGSDDGCVYCLAAADGREVWRFRAAPSGRKLLGSGKMISLWPLRTGVLVDGGVAYFTAGVFPAEGVYLYALDAADGKLLWCNDQGGAAPTSRISPQGYLLASKSTLFVPMGRVSPAAYDRQSGRLLHETYFTHRIGGTYALLDGGRVYTGTEALVAYDQKSRAKSAWLEGRQLALTADTAYLLDERELKALDRAKFPKPSLRRRALLDRRIKAARPLRSARRNEQRLAAPVQQAQRQLGDIDKQIAAVGKEDPKLAELQALRTSVAARLARGTKALEAAKRATAKHHKAIDALNGQFQENDAELDAATRWRCPTTCADALVLAGGTLVAGGRGQVLAADAATGKQLWTADVDGAAKGLAVADGRLYVSTDTGAIYCFAPDGAPQHGTVKQAANPAPFPRDEQTPLFEAAADHIVKATGIRRGYCLVLGVRSGRLTAELAKRTELQFCAVCPDADHVAAARAALDRAGLYGSRVVVEQAAVDRLPHADYFANLIVSEGPLMKNRMPFSVHEALRVLKPLGGTVCFGQPAGAAGKAEPCSTAMLGQWIEAAKVEGAKITDDEKGVWLTYTRGKLPGAGSWTHQYAESGNTTCSDDLLVKCPLGVLWFGDPGPTEMAERHRRAASPLAVGGRLFVMGEGKADRIGAGPNALMAYDAYNGVKLWEREVPSALRTVVSHDGGNMAADATSLFIAAGDHCVRINQATGETTATYALPPAADGKPRRWGWVATVGGVLYGSRTATRRSGDCVFARDVATGKLLWQHEGKSIPQGALVVGGGRLLLATSSVSDAQRDQALQELAAASRRADKAERAAIEKRLKAAIVQLVVCLDARTGERLWQKPLELSACNSGAYWSSLGAIVSRDVLVLFGIFSDGHYWRQFFAGQFNQRQVVALSATDGHRLWSKNIGYRVRPIVVGDTLHAEPWAFDLRTGQQKMRTHPVTGREETWQFARPGHHCGAPAACPNVMLFRSYTLAWYDLVGDYGTQHFGALRPGCWINFIPANGLLLVPEASSGCLCPFPNMCTVVFKHRDESRQWAYFSQPGPLTPVKRLALNLGAPGDRRDPAGTLWLGYPRPGGSLVLRFKVALSYFPGWSTFRHDPAKLEVAGTDAPWVFRSGIRGLRKCEIPLMGAEDGTARFTVRLAFADLDQGEPGARVFDIKLQGKVVAEGFDVAAAAGGQSKAVVKEFQGVECDGKLTIELVAKAAKPEAHQLPILQGVDIEREQVVGLGFAVPSFVLNDLEPEQAGEVRIANHKDGDFVGTLRIESPGGFAVTPAAMPVKLASGERTAVPLKAVVAKKGERGTYGAAIRLLRRDGAVECERKATIEYLGAFSRAVIKVAEDAYVGKGFATQNRGTTTNLLVDGGDAQMGDQSHHIAYLKFPIDVPGTIASATVRLYNAGNPTGDSGRLCLVADPWREKAVTYDNRPKPGQELARIGRVAEEQIVELTLDPAILAGRKALSLVIDPTSCDGVDYTAREGRRPAELVVEYRK